MNASDQRKEDRTEKEEKVFIEVLSTSVNGDQSLVVECSTADISSSGLKVTSHFPISTGALLEILVDFNANSMKYLLTGEVKWVRQINDEPTYQCGFELVEAEHSDIFVWRELFESDSTEY